MKRNELLKHLSMPRPFNSRPKIRAENGQKSGMKMIGGVVYHIERKITVIIVGVCGKCTGVAASFDYT